MEDSLRVNVINTNYNQISGGCQKNHIENCFCKLCIVLTAVEKKRERESQIHVIPFLAYDVCEVKILKIL